MNNAAVSPARSTNGCASVEPLLRVISLGAGVQSSTLLLMALRGEFEDAKTMVSLILAGSRLGFVF
mgnify:CR=1 FL=1